MCETKSVVLDLSHHNRIGDAGFHQMVKDGVLGVIHKASEGVGFRDREYAGRRRRAKSVGLLWGAYHWVTDAPVASQVSWFLESLKPYRFGSELIAVDWEPDKNIPGGFVKRSHVEAFVDALAVEIGRVPVLYSGYAFLNDRKIPNSSILATCPLWVARYAKELGPVPAPWETYTLWQHTPKGKVAGVVGKVDRNRVVVVGGTVEGWPFA